MPDTGLLLATHVLLWALTDSPRLGAQTRRRIASSSVVRYSAASTWEIAVKSASGRLDPPEPVVAAAERAGINPLPVTVEHTLAVRRSPLAHADPFDRLLVAQAAVEGTQLLTADVAILQVGLPYVVDART